MAKKETGRGEPRPVFGLVWLVGDLTHQSIAYLAATAPAQCRWRVVTRLGLVREVVHVVFIVQAVSKIASRQKIHMHFKRGPETEDIIVVDAVSLRHTPKATPVVVLIDDQYTPTVLVHVKAALGINVALAIL